MERKTIGSFIATLRKANGMTQKDLAEKLNVSDKSVSRWERDDGAPDLSVIPVIAEIFGVTCDELLRGERVSPTQRTENVLEENEFTQKGEKQMQRILNSSFSKYKNLSLISVGIVVAGLLVAMICNFGFLKSSVGFFAGSVFYLVALISQMIFLNNSLLAVSDESIQGTEIQLYKQKVISIAEKVFGTILVVFAFTLPLFTMGNAHYGLNFSYWLLVGVIFAFIAIVIVCVVCFFVNKSLVENKVYELTEKEEKKYYTNSNLKYKYAKVYVLTACITLFVHLLSVFNLFSPENIAEKEVFNDYDSFVEYMERNVVYDDGHTVEIEIFDQETIESVVIGESGSPPKCQLTTEGGTVVCEYYDNNMNVYSIDYKEKNGNLLPITIITNSAYSEAKIYNDIINMGFLGMYLIELFIVIRLYYRKRAK